MLLLVLFRWFGLFGQFGSLGFLNLLAKHTVVFPQAAGLFGFLQLLKLLLDMRGVGFPQAVGLFGLVSFQEFSFLVNKHTTGA